jgi:hypothetical protein
MKEKDDSDSNSCSSESVDSESLKYNNKDKDDSILNIEKNKYKNEIILNDSKNKNYNYNENEENDDINTINKCNSYNSVFSFANVTRKDFNNINYNNINNNKLEEKIRTSELNENNEISIWETIKQQIENVKNHIVFNFNIFSGLNNLDLSDEKLPKNIQIFDEKFSKQDEKLINVLQNIPWFSYRKNFNQIKDKENIFTTDAGWGCMIRASQMILAQGIYKLFSIKNLNEFFNEFITFFYDNKIPLKLLVKKNSNSNKDINNKKENKKQENKNNKIKEETFNDFLIVDITREHRLSFVDITKEMVEELENLSKQENNNQNLVTPPFSLRNIIKTQNKINPNGKKVGEWFSNYDLIKIITKINKQMIKQQDCDFKVINFENETIYIEDLIKECFEEVETQGFEYLSKSDFSDCKNIKENFNINETILNEEVINKNIKNEFYVFNKKRYTLKQKFIIFISVRHGLHNLNEDLFNEVLKIFDIKTNIGLIGGKNSRAFYFIGKCENNLIFLDPHYVQATIPLNILGTNQIGESYKPNDIYYMDISELSPSFSIGFAIKDIKDFKLFMEKMTSEDYFIDQNIYNSLGKKSNYLFMVKNFHFPYRNNDDSNQDISNNIDVRENYY